jgi:hypothetical protein
VGPTYGKPIRSILWKFEIDACGRDRQQRIESAIVTKPLRVDPSLNPAVQRIEDGADRRFAIVPGGQRRTDREVLTASLAGTHDGCDDHLT